MQKTGKSKEKTTLFRTRLELGLRAGLRGEPKK
jgi:hypothetical protein